MPAAGRFDPFTELSGNDGVDGAPNGISVPRWSLSKPHLKGSRPRASLSGICRLSRGLVSIWRRSRPDHRIGDHGHDQDASAFASGREFAAFLGLTPRQNSTGGKTRLGRITKMGDRYLRKLLVLGACATLRHRRGHSDALRLWASGMFERKTVKYKFHLTAVALANKVARIVFVLMTRGGQYDGRPVAARTNEAIR